MQNNNRNTATAIVMRPTGATGGLSAQSYPGDLIAFQKELTTGSTVSLSAEVYTGPNELIRYDQEGYLELAGLFRPNILGRLSLAILWVLHTIHDGIGNWGLSIIVLTLVFRAVIWPLISTQTRSMYGMQELQPKIKTLQKKYKDDRQKLTEETMKLYKEAGVNPAGGCLPILAQMPLFIILWRVFVNFEFNEGFLWITRGAVSRKPRHPARRPRPDLRERAGGLSGRGAPYRGEHPGHLRGAHCPGARRGLRSARR